MDKYQSRFTGVEIDARLAKVNQEFTLEEKEKLSGLVNYDDTEVWEVLETRVEKVEGKGLSSNDFTDDDKSKLNGLYNYDDTTITQAVEELQTSKANADDVYNKEETDSAITAKVSEIVAGAPEEFDTLKEMSDWLTEHEDSAAAMNTAIQKNAADIASNKSAIESNDNDIAEVKNESLLLYGTLGTTSKNLFNKNGIITNQYISSDGSLTPNPSARLSDYIKIDGKPFVVSATIKTAGDALRVGVYDENKNFLNYYHGYNKEHLAVNDSRAVFVRISVFTTNYDIDTLQLELGTAATEYEPYVPSVAEQIEQTKSDISSLENTIESINTTLSNTMQSTDITIITGGVQKYVKIGMTTGAVTEYLIIIQTTTGAGYTTYLFRGYGDGGTARCRITRLNGGTSPSTFINNRDLYIELFDTNNTHYISVYTLQGSIPTLTVTENYSGNALATTLPAELEARLVALEAAITPTTE